MWNCTSRHPAWHVRVLSVRYRINAIPGMHQEASAHQRIRGRTRTVSKEAFWVTVHRWGEFPGANKKIIISLKGINLKKMFIFRILLKSALTLLLLPRKERKQNTLKKKRSLPFDIIFPEKYVLKCIIMYWVNVLLVYWKIREISIWKMYQSVSSHLLSV
jgi:hypothetical protein